jgi:thioredoxin-related protein
MTSRRRALELISGAGLASLLPLARGANSADPLLNDDGLFTQPWFMQTFLDLRDDQREASEADKRFAVIWEQKGCPYCKEMHLVNFAKPAVSDYVKSNFGIVQLNLWGSREVTDFNGKVMEERQLARAWRVNFTPTIQFFAKSLPPQNEGGSGKGGMDLEVARIPGYFKPFHFLSMFEFVHSEAYVDTNFQRFLQDRFAEMKAKGVDPNVW